MKLIFVGLFMKNEREKWKMAADFALGIGLFLSLGPIRKQIGPQLKPLYHDFLYK